MTKPPPSISVQTVLGPATWSLSEGWRNAAQLEAVASIAGRPGFSHFVGGNPFDAPPGRKYEGPFVVLWRESPGLLRGALIGKTGRILSEARAAPS